MAVIDFAKIADSWLAQLQNDPSRPLPPDVEPTTFPLGGSELDGQVIDIDRDSDAPTIGGGRSSSDEDIDAGRWAYREVGVDVLAFYKSFRFRDRPPFRGKWGIFLLDAGIGAVAAEYAAMNPSLPVVEVKELAVATLLAHERYHFWIDAWALGQEILPIGPRIKRYEYYLDMKRHADLTKFDFEESLANHYAFRQLRSRKLSDQSMAGRLVRTFFESCPEPYSSFSYNPEARAHREGVLAAAVANGISPVVSCIVPRLAGLTDIGIASPGIRPAPALHPLVNHQSCPVYEVWVTGYAARVQPFQGPPLGEFRQFVERYLAGKKERTDHDYYLIDNGEKVKFPNPHDKEVRGYELKGTLHKAGMTHKEFVHARMTTQYWKRNCPRQPPKPPLGT